LADFEPIGHAVILARTIGKEVLIDISVIIYGVEKVFDIIKEYRLAGSEVRK
jgi:hypothetical protein